jgi:hypothetical protein
MGRRTGGTHSAMGNVLGAAMKAAIEAGLTDPTWKALAEQIAAASWDQQHPDDQDETPLTADPEPVPQKRGKRPSGSG